MSYGFHHEGRTFFPNGRPAIEKEPPEAAEARNRAQSAAEVEAFRNRSADRWFVYVKATPQPNPAFTPMPWGQLTTWTGDKLADFEWSGPEYHCPAFGGYSVRRNLRARGIDGREWCGTAYVSSGDYARIRVVKGV